MPATTVNIMWTEGDEAVERSRTAWSAAPATGAENAKQNQKSKSSKGGSGVFSKAMDRIAAKRASSTAPQPTFTHHSPDSKPQPKKKPSVRLKSLWPRPVSTEPNTRNATPSASPGFATPADLPSPRPASSSSATRASTSQVEWAGAQEGGGRGRGGGGAPSSSAQSSASASASLRASAASAASAPPQARPLSSPAPSPLPSRPTSAHRKPRAAPASAGKAAKAEEGGGGARASVGVLATVLKGAKKAGAKAAAGRKKGSYATLISRDPVTYWNSLASCYDEDVFSSIDEDLNGIVRACVMQYGNRQHRAADFGCGTGHYLRHLSDSFQDVIGIDLSPKLLERARGQVADCSNVRLLVHDLSQPLPALPLVHFGVLANVLISPNPEHPPRILASVHRQLHPAAHLLVVVPSTEAALYIHQREEEATRLQRRKKHPAAFADSFKMVPSKQAAQDAFVGVFERGGVKTKHYLREEMELVAQRSGYEVAGVQKVEFRWDVELTDVDQDIADSISKPYPWDWMFLLVKPARGGQSQGEATATQGPQAKSKAGSSGSSVAQKAVVI